MWCLDDMDNTYFREGARLAVEREKALGHVLDPEPDYAAMEKVAEEKAALLAKIEAAKKRGEVLEVLSKSTMPQMQSLSLPVRSIPRPRPLHPTQQQLRRVQSALSTIPTLERPTMPIPQLSTMQTTPVPTSPLRLKIVLVKTVVSATAALW